MKKILTVTLLLISSIGFTQNAKAFLDEVSKTVKSYENITINFDHSIENLDANLHQTNSGNATLKGNLYHFEYLGVEQFYDGHKIYMIIEEDEEVIIKQPNSNEPGSVTPSKMLTFYEDGFTYKMDIKQNVQGKTIQYVKLVPIDSNSELQSILLGVEADTKHIYKVIETGKDSTVTTYTITKFVTNQNVSDALFTFNKSLYEAKDFDITEPK